MKHLNHKARATFAGLFWICAASLHLFAQTPAGTEIENVATAQYEDGGGFVYSIQSQPVITTISQGYWVTISKSVERTFVLSSDTVVYHITLNNSGNIAALSVSVIDTLSSNIIYVSSQPSATVNGQEISWNLLALQPGATVEIELIGLVAPGVSSGTSIENSAGFHTPENVTGNSNRVGITIGSAPDLVLQKSVNRLNASAGDTLAYTITLKNSGNARSTNTVIYDDLPEQTEFVSCSGNGQSVFGILAWNIGEITPGTTITETVKVIVKTGVSPGFTINNIASAVNSEGNERSAGAATLVIEEARNPDLWIEKTAGATASPGDSLIYRIVFGNRGNAPGTGIVMTDTLSPDVEFISTTGIYQYESAAHRVVWNSDDLASGSIDSVDLIVRVRAGISDGTQLLNRAQIICSEGDTGTTHAAVTILSPVLTITKIASEAVVSAGSELKYTIVFQNTGNGSAGNVIITDTLSADFEYVSSTGSAQFDPQKRVVTWSCGTLAAQMTPAQSVELIVRLKSPLSNGMTIANSAGIGSDEGFSGKASVNITVESAPVLTILKTTESQAFPGDTLVYDLVCANSGNAVAMQTTVSDTLSALVEFIDATGVYVYEASKHIVQWNLGDLAPDLDANLTLRVKIKSSLTGSFELANAAWIRSAESSGHSDIARTEVTSLSLHVTANPDSIIGNGVDRSRITATVSDATGQPVTDGTAVVFMTSHGSFDPGTDTVLTLNGIASTRLKSSLIDREFVHVTVTAKLIVPVDTPISDSTTVVFYSGSVIGLVTRSDQAPVHGATVDLRYNGANVGTDTTSGTGNYRIPVFVSGSYNVRIQTVDQSGRARLVEQELEIVIPDSGRFNPFSNRNAVSGRIVDLVSQKTIREANVPVILTRETSSALAKESQIASADTAVTDTSGFWSFSNLDPGKYGIMASYNGTSEYHDGQNAVVIDLPGQYMTDADIALRQVPFKTYKTVDKPQALTGDTLTYRIFYETLANAITDTFRITDQLPSELEWIPTSLIHSPELILDGFDAVTNELQFHRLDMPADQVDSVIFRSVVKNDIPAGVVVITNQANVLNQIDTIKTSDDNRSKATTRIISPFLAMKKSVNRRVAETGDVLTYAVTLENRSSDAAVGNLIITDILPYGFRYREKRSAWNGKSLSDPSVSMPDHRQVLIWTISDTLLPGKSSELKYRVIVGLDSRFGENENLAMATATLSDGITISSNQAKAEVILKPGMLQERGFIIGKVFYDTNGNNLHDQNEETVKGVEIITQEGARVITDQFGKYSIPNVRSGDHVLRINRKTLPENSFVRLTSSDFLGDSTSRLVKMTPGGIAKANFILQKPPKAVPPPPPPVLPPVSESVALSLTKTHTQTDTAYIDVSQMALTKAFRILVYKPWSMTLRLGFPSGEATIIRADENVLDKIVEFLTWQKHISVEIYGHTNDLPLPEGAKYKDNMELSHARADAVMAYLKQRGIQADRIKTDGFGETKPLVPNDSPENRVANRRVEIIFHTPEELRPYGANLRFRADFRYSGTLPLQNVRFTDQIPDGFFFEENTAEFDSVLIAGEKIDDKQVRWDLGDWSTPALHQLNYGLIPINHRLIQSNSSINGVLEFETPDDQNNQTRTLKNTIDTHVQEVLLKVTLEGALFDFGSARLTAGAMPSLKKVGEFMTWQNQMNISIEGFTDSVGGFPKNQILSEKRAVAVKTYLTKNYQIAPERIRTEGFGEYHPVADNGTVNGRALNRRVEIIVNSDFVQKESFDLIILSDSLQHRVEKTKVLTDSLSTDGGWLISPGDTIRPHVLLRFAEPPAGTLVRITASLPEGLFFPTAVSDTLKQVQTWILPAKPDQDNFELEWEIGSDPALQTAPEIRIHIETLDEKMSVKGVAEKTIIVGVRRP